MDGAQATWVAPSAMVAMPSTARRTHPLRARVVGGRHRVQTAGAIG